MFSDFIAPDDPRWAALLDRAPHDVYHLPEYTVLAAKHEAGVPAAFYAESDDKEILIPLLLRAIPQEIAGAGGWTDVSSPYGYPCPLATDRDDREWLANAFVAFRRRACERRIVTAFLRLHPLRGTPPEALAPFATVVQHGPVVFIDLTKPCEELWSDTRLNHRRNIKRLRDAGFTVTMDDWSGYEAFGPLYRETMARVGASPFYLFTDAYFRDLRQMLGTRLHLCTVAAPDGDVAAAGLFTQTNGIVEYHLAGTAAAYLAHAPSKLMFDEVRQWGKRLGASILHLGGGTGGTTSSLFEFKAGFSPSRALFHTARIIFDHRLYRDLVRTASPHADSDAPASGFFPVYRELPAARPSVAQP
jgi:hypothetical protein